jgi:hypothetical protein
LPLGIAGWQQDSAGTAMAPGCPNQPAIVMSDGWLAQSETLRSWSSKWMSHRAALALRQPTRNRKAELSTLPRLGTFYFALTQGGRGEFINLQLLQQW